MSEILTRRQFLEGAAALTGVLGGIAVFGTREASAYPIITKSLPGIGEGPLKTVGLCIDVKNLDGAPAPEGTFVRARLLQEEGLPDSRRQTVYYKTQVNGRATVVDADNVEHAYFYGKVDVLRPVRVCGVLRNDFPGEVVVLERRIAVNPDQWVKKPARVRVPADIENCNPVCYPMYIEPEDQPVQSKPREKEQTPEAPESPRPAPVTVPARVPNSGGGGATPEEIEACLRYNREHGLPEVPQCPEGVTP